MQILNYIKFISVIVILICSSTAIAIAQQLSPDKEIVDDIEIMETVLDRLLAPEGIQIHFWGSNTRGYYLMNYGVIFNVNYPLMNKEMISINLEKQFELTRKQFLYIDEENNDEDVTRNAAENFEKEIEQLKKSVIRFLGSWTSALTSLNPGEKVTVIVDFNGFAPRFPGAFEASLHQLIASVPVGEIINYRKGKLNDEEFPRRVTFDQVKSIDEDISILSNVIRTSLEHVDSKTAFGISGDVRGIYFKGYGVIFFTDVTMGTNVFTIYSEALSKAKERSIRIKSDSDLTKGRDQSKDKIEQKLIQLISNYGHTVRNLEPEDWFEIALNFIGFPLDDKYSKSIFKVQKKVIDDYNRGKIEFEQFRKIVQITYY